jgi:hypothetical protein
MKGEIWRSDLSGNYKAVIINHKIANSIFKDLRKPGKFRYGDEAILTFTEIELPKIIKVLGVITDLKIAKRRASNFNNLVPPPPGKSKVKKRKIEDTYGEVSITGASS